jgi:hypothetical protein
MVVVLSIVAVTAIGSNMTFARITQQDTSCTNGGGNQPGGQQPWCKGSALTQNTKIQFFCFSTEYL